MSPAAALGCFAVAIAGLAPYAPAPAATVPSGLSDLPVVAGLQAPVGLAFLPDGRLFVIEQQTATVRLVIPADTIIVSEPATPILTLPDVNTVGAERGLLGIAVDPGWPNRSFVYLQYNHDGDSKIRISRFRVTGDLDRTGFGSLAIDPASRFDVLTDAPDNAPNHNGGTLRFGPDRMLYASLGEDGVRCAAQNTGSLRGVILRLDVSRLPTLPGGPAPKALIAAPGNPFAAHPDSNARLVWAFGLRNPFRFHVDMPTGDLFVADVGEYDWEEVDRASAGGLNFGWPHYEGPALFGQSCSDNNFAFSAPIHAYNRHGTTASIIGGVVYRRPAIGVDRLPAFYEGDYFFNDYYLGFLRRLTGSGNAWTLSAAVPGQPNTTDWGTGFKQVSDWAVSPSGALWYCRQSDDRFGAGTGEIRRIVFSPGAAPVIVSVQATAGPDGRSATLRWLTDIEADSRVDYGTDPAILDQSVAQTPRVLDHAVSLGGLEPETVYFYRVSSTAAGGGTTVAPDPKSPPNDFLTFPLPGTVRLLAPFPSPAVGGATLPFDLAHDASVMLRVYDLRGRLVRRLVDGETRGAGANAEPWNGRDDEGRAAPAGIYVVRLGVEGRHFERRFPMIR